MGRGGFLLAHQSPKELAGLGLTERLEADMGQGQVASQVDS